jgi:nucleoside-diphosphate-sugar epimerase
MANYLVTGAAGFIASSVIEMLLEAGHSVVGVDNMNDAYDVRMKEFRLKQLQRRSISYFPPGYAERMTIPVSRLFGSKLTCVSTAAKLGSPVGGKSVGLSGYQYRHAELLEYCRELKIPKFILASTSSVYGSNAPLPTPETYSSDLPLQAYAATKKSAEVLCHVYHYLYGLDVTVFRYFTVYGPAPRPDMVMFRFTQWLNEVER